MQPLHLNIRNSVFTRSTKVLTLSVLSYSRALESQKDVSLTSFRKLYHTSWRGINYGLSCTLTIGQVQNNMTTRTEALLHEHFHRSSW